MIVCLFKLMTRVVSINNIGIMFQINLCSPLYDELQDQTGNLRVTRILFGIDLLLLCIIYNCISFLLKKDLNSLRLEDKESNQSKIESLERFYKVPRYLQAMGKLVSIILRRPHRLHWICHDLFSFWVRALPRSPVSPPQTNIRGSPSEMGN